MAQKKEEDGATARGHAPAWLPEADLTCGKDVPEKNGERRGASASVGKNAVLAQSRGAFFLTKKGRV